MEIITLVEEYSFLHDRFTTMEPNRYDIIINTDRLFYISINFNCGKIVDHISELPRLLVIYVMVLTVILLESSIKSKLGNPVKMLFNHIFIGKPC